MKKICGNKYDLSGDYGIGYCQNTNTPFFFDKEDFELIKDYKWGENPNGYIRAYKYINKKVIAILLHRLVMNPPKGTLVDHRNHNRTDCRKENLRMSSYSQNNMNKKVSCASTSGYSGVNFAKNRNKWGARIQLEHKRKWLGYFDTFEEAVAARKAAEKEYFGEYAYDPQKDVTI